MDNGYFYSTVENLEERTFLTAYEQRVALTNLQNAGWIDVKKKGMPAKRYIRIFEDKICEVVYNQSLKNLTTGGENISQQVVKNFDINKNITNKNIEKELSKDSIEGKRPRFTPPTFEEVSAYCQERNNNIDPQQFIDFYTSKNWYVGKTKMVDWKACVRTWERRSYNRPKQNPENTANPFTELKRKEGML